MRYERSLLKMSRSDLMKWNYRKIWLFKSNSQRIFWLHWNL